MHRHRALFIIFEQFIAIAIDIIYLNLETFPMQQTPPYCMYAGHMHEHTCADEHDWFPRCATDRWRVVPSWATCDKGEHDASPAEMCLCICNDMDRRLEIGHYYQRRAVCVCAGGGLTCAYLLLMAVLRCKGWIPHKFRHISIQPPSLWLWPGPSQLATCWD